MSQYPGQYRHFIYNKCEAYWYAGANVSVLEAYCGATGEHGTFITYEHFMRYGPGLYTNVTCPKCWEHPTIKEWLFEYLLEGQ